MNGDCLSGVYINNLQRKNEYQGIDYIFFQISVFKFCIFCEIN